jgi:hypothetical protein
LSAGAASPEAVEDAAGASLTVQSSRSKHERGEVHFVGELEQSIERAGPGIEGRRPGLDLRDVSEASGRASSSFSCFPDEPRKMRGLSIVETISHRPQVAW